MKLLSWNLKHGGTDPRHASGTTPPARLERILDLLAGSSGGPLPAFGADLLVLTEWHSTYRDVLERVLHDAGYCDIQSSEPPERVNGVCIASRTPLTTSPLPKPAGVNPVRWLEVGVPAFDVVVAGIYAPASRSTGEIDTFWRAVVEAAQDRVSSRAVLIGDFNTGIPGRDWLSSNTVASKYLKALYEGGWVDAWWQSHPGADPADYEYPYYQRSPSGARIGYRIDHALIAPVLATDTVHCHYVHEVRHQRVSDHSALLLDLPQVPATTSLRAPDDTVVPPSR